MIKIKHLKGEESLSLIYKTMYEWVNTLTERSFNSLIKSTLFQSKPIGWATNSRAEELSKEEEKERRYFPFREAEILTYLSQNMIMQRN